MIGFPLAVRVEFSLRRHVVTTERAKQYYYVLTFGTDYQHFESSFSQTCFVEPPKARSQCPQEVQKKPETTSFKNVFFSNVIKMNALFTC